MRVYHFVNLQYGLDDIRQRRLKVATFSDLNDPFELLAVASTNPVTREVHRRWKAGVTQYSGVLCFSSDWRNPVMWSHYADGHRGLCLGFDVSAELLPVRYTSKRLQSELNLAADGSQISQEEIIHWLTTKYSHWRYEKEHRIFVRLDEKDKNGFYFVDFSNSITLKEVIAGHSSAVSRSDIANALGDIAPKVELWKARLAFKTYRVTRQRNESLWR